MSSNLKLSNLIIRVSKYLHGRKLLSYRPKYRSKSFVNYVYKSKRYIEKNPAAGRFRKSHKKTKKRTKTKKNKKNKKHKKSKKYIKENGIIAKQQKAGAKDITYGLNYEINTTKSGKNSDLTKNSNLTKNSDLTIKSDSDNDINDIKIEKQDYDLITKFDFVNDITSVKQDSNLTTKFDLTKDYAKILAANALTKFHKDKPLLYSSEIVKVAQDYMDALANNELDQSKMDSLTDQYAKLSEAAQKTLDDELKADNFSFSEDDVRIKAKHVQEDLESEQEAYDFSFFDDSIRMEAEHAQDDWLREQEEEALAGLSEKEKLDILANHYDELSKHERNYAKDTKQRSLEKMTQHKDHDKLAADIEHTVSLYRIANHYAQQAAEAREAAHKALNDSIRMEAEHMLDDLEREQEEEAMAGLSEKEKQNALANYYDDLSKQERDYAKLTEQLSLEKMTKHKDPNKLAADKEQTVSLYRIADYYAKLAAEAREAARALPD
ncbi:MAG: hypothetical protein ACK5F0_00070 [Flavobacteriales bacterium]